MHNGDDDHAGARTAGGFRDRGLASTSPVLAEWFVTWNDIAGDEERPTLQAFLGRLPASRGSVDQEVARQWMVIDWLVRTATPIWLRAVHLTAHADRLEALPLLARPQVLAEATERCEAVATAAAEVHEASWSAVAELAQPDASADTRRPGWRPPAGATDPRRIKTWGGLADGTRAALRPTGQLIAPATHAVGYDPAAAGAPAAWQALTATIDDAAAITAWQSTTHLVTAPTWAWDVSPETAWRTACTAARARLQPVERAHHASAHTLIRQLLAVTEGTNT